MGVEEARAEVQKCEEAIAEAEELEKVLTKQADEAKKNMDAASARVEEATHKETVALEKLKAARMQKFEAAGGKAKVQDDRAEAAKGVLILQLEWEARAKRKEL